MRAWRRRALAALVALVSCKGEPTAVLAPTVTSIELSAPTLSVQAIGEPVQFTATARDEAGVVVDGVEFSWSSTMPGVASVSGAGVVTSTGNGSTSISASARNVTGEVSFSVTQTPASMVVVGGNGQSALARDALATQLRVRVLDSRSSPIGAQPVVWEVLSGGGSIVGTGTDGTGHATATWTMGSIAGAASARATAGSVAMTLGAVALPNGVIQGTVTMQSAYLAPQPSGVAMRALLGGVAPSGLAARSGAVNAAAFPPPAAVARDAQVPGELLVRLRTATLALPAAGSMAYRSGAQAGAAAQTLRAVAAGWTYVAPLEVLGASPALATVRVRVAPADVEAVRARLLALPEVEGVEPNGSMTALEGVWDAPTAASSEPYFARQAWHYDVIDAVRAWGITTGSASVIVAVVDDGIRFDHPDVAANLRSDGFDFVPNTPLSGCPAGSYTASMDGNGPDPDPTIPAALTYNDNAQCVTGFGATGGHGLHVAGTIGARASNGQGGVGVAWVVGIRPVRVLGSHGSGSVYDIAQGILYAAGLPADGGSAGIVQTGSAARIINLSLGGPSGSTTLQSAVIAASNAGSLLIAAAGNNNSSAPHYPAAYPEVLSVSAMASDFTRAAYSSYGATVDIAGPGGELSPDAEYGVWSTLWSFQANAPIYQAFQGTSMATPHVSGVAALVLAANPGLSAAQLRARLIDHAFDIGATGPDDEFGVGLVNAEGSVRGASTPMETWVSVFDVQSGARRGRIRATANGAYVIGALPDGQYTVFAGQDRSGDGVTGTFARRWGALGGSTTPSAVSISGSSIASTSFSIGYPIESESNGSTGEADPLPLGGYAYGTISAGSDLDLYRIDVGAATTLRVETDAFLGSCGFRDEVDTVVRILNAAGSPLAGNDDVDTALERRCSGVSLPVSPGTYYAEVSGWSGDTGFYAVRAFGS